MEEMAILSISTPVVNEVRKTILSLDAHARLILFGSRARAQRFYTLVPSDSDWDFLVLTREALPESWIRDFLHHLELKTDAVISTIIYPQAEWSGYRYTPLYQNINEDGIAIAMNYDKQTIIKYRIERAKETWEEAQRIADNHYWNATVNRLYYACFYIVHALLLSNDRNVHTHSDTKSAFHQDFVKSGRVPPTLSRFYDLLFSKRQSGDYGDMNLFTQAEIAPLLPEAKKFIDAIEVLITPQP